MTIYLIELTSCSYGLFFLFQFNLPRMCIFRLVSPIFTIILILTTIACSGYNCSKKAKLTGVLIHKIKRDSSNVLQNALVLLKKPKSRNLIFFLSDPRVHFADHSWTDRDLSQRILQNRFQTAWKYDYSYRYVSCYHNSI